MALSKKPYKGTRDFFPADKRIQDYMFNKMRQAAESYGYESYDGPLLEEVELYKAKSGEELINEQIYSFHDRGERFLAIRPEMTPTLARMVAQVHRNEIKPLRWFSIPNLYRYERAQRGRLREHWQFNCDIFGAPGKMGEVEIVSLVINFLKSFGATGEMFELLLNDRAIVDAVFNELLQVEGEVAYKLYKIVDKSKKVPREKLEEEVSELLGDENKAGLFWNYMELSSFDDVLAFLKENKKDEVLEQMTEFSTAIESLGLNEFVKYDPAIVRGLDYYTGIVFEVFDKHPDNRRAICGGGAYANLLKIFNEPSVPGVGFGLGDVTLKDFLETHGLLPDLSSPSNDVLVTVQCEEAMTKSMLIAGQLRMKGHKVITGLEPVKFKKVFKLAEQKGASFAIMIGENELSEGKLVIKNLENRDQKDFQLDDIQAMNEFITGA